MWQCYFQFQKQSQLKLSNYRSIYLRSNIEKVLCLLVISNRLYKFLESHYLQFLLQLSQSTFHALIHQTENKRGTRQGKLWLWNIC